MFKQCSSTGCRQYLVDESKDYCFTCESKQQAAEPSIQYIPTAPVSIDSDDSIDSDYLDLIDVSKPYAGQKASPYTPRSVKNGYLPFIVPGYASSDIVIRSNPQLLFKPEALMLWGFDDATVVNSVYVGQQVQGSVSFGPIPAAFFGTAKTYEKLVQDFAANGISPPNWISWSTCHVGQTVSIIYRGHLSFAVMLGKVVV